MRLFVFLSVLLFAVDAAAADLNVEFRGINPQKGNILVGLYASEATFENAPLTFGQNGGLMEDRGPLGATVKVDAPTLTARFTDLEPGQYAILAIHDLNRNGRLDRFFGVPMEPFSFYQASPPVNIPTYANTSVNLTGSSRTVVVTFGSDAAQ